MLGRQLHCWAPNPECSLGLLGLSEVQSILVTDSQTLQALAGLATDLLADGTVGSKTFELNLFLVSRSDQSHIKLPPTSLAATALDLAAVYLCI